MSMHAVVDGRPMRSDTERNRRRLVKAASLLVARRGTSVKMVDVAEQAEVSTATAYRHFSSLEEILTEFRHGVGASLRTYSTSHEATGVELLEAVSREWVRLVVKHGAAMVHSRSEEGYLERLRRGAEYLTVQADALRRPIEEATNDLGIELDPEIGVFLWNVMFDPREIFDLLETLGLSQLEATHRLVAAWVGAVHGWAGAEIPATDNDSTARPTA